MKAAIGLVPTAATLIATLDWTQIVVALITLSGVIFTGICTVYVAKLARLVRTPSKRSIGEQVENSHHIAITNRLLLARIAREMGIKADDPDVRAILGDHDADRFAVEAKNALESAEDGHER